VNKINRGKHLFLEVLDLGIFDTTTAIGSVRNYSYANLDKLISCLLLHKTLMDKKCIKLFVRLALRCLDNLD